MSKKQRLKSKISRSTPFPQNFDNDSSERTHQKRWTPDEDEDFLSALYQCGYGKWTQIASVLGNRTPLQVKNRARHLILYETGTKLSDILREMSSSNNNSNHVIIKGSPPVATLVSRRSSSRAINYAEEDQDEEESFEESEIPSDNETIESGVDSDLENLNEHLHLNASNSSHTYYEESDSIPSVNPSLLLSRSFPSLERSPLLPLPHKSLAASHVAFSQEDGDYNNEGDEVEKELNSLINCSQISEKERFALPEFFQGMSLTRTPERYLKIRSTILSLWSARKPQYVTKLSARVALRGIAGDVSLISKVHAYLEKAKLINYCLDSEEHDRKQKKKAKLSKKRSHNSSDINKKDHSKGAVSTKSQLKAAGLTIRYLKRWDSDWT